MALTSTGYEVLFLKPQRLKPHEECRPEHVAKIEASLRREKVVKRPILIEKKSRIILDGHHRHRALLKIKCSLVPVVMLEIDHDIECVRSRRPNLEVSHLLVSQMVVQEKLFPPKSTRYITCHEIGNIYLPVSLLLP